MKRKVLLVNPRSCSKRSIRLPLSLLSLGAVLEGRYPYYIVDENVDPDPVGTLRGHLADGEPALLGVSVMPGPQVAPAIAIASAIRQSHPSVPIVWGGYFPTLYTESAVNAPYVDYVVRGQGEMTLLELLAGLSDRARATGDASLGHTEATAKIHGLTWKDGDGIRHNPDRHFVPPDNFPPFPYERVGDVMQYMRPSFFGTRTGVHQAATGCRYRCTFCGVASMFNGSTRLQGPDRLYDVLTTMRDRYGATGMQYFDNNFFDREETSVAMLEVMAKVPLPYWCFARADTLSNFSASTWEGIRRSQLRMAYIGAEASSDTILKGMKKGTKVEHTFEVAARCRENGVIPEFSFILGGPEDPENEMDKTFTFIRRLKKQYPECEIILYFYSPTPQRLPGSTLADRAVAQLPVMSHYGSDALAVPTTPAGWAQPQWVAYVSHLDAPWLTPAMRDKVRDFKKVLACRFPTVQDYRTPRWGKSVLRNLAGWRYATGQYRNAWELDVARRWIPLREPQTESL